MEWTRGHTIGQGSTAIVSIATTTTTTSGDRKTFAVKSIELSKSEFLQREQKLLSSLDHPHIVAYKGYDVTMENNKVMFNLKMQYFPRGTLSDAIKRARGGRIEESMISCYTRHIVQGLEYLHSIGVVHCDIKGENILLGQNGGATIADFGCAKKRDSCKIAGTPLFMAPEVARGEEQGYPADIWALGCTVLEMATGCCSPWPNATNFASLLYRIGNTEDLLPEIPQSLSDQTKDFLKMCLRRDPKERWTAKDLLKHKFLDEFSGDSKGEIQSLYSLSPTSILEQGMWSPVYESKAVIKCVIPENSRVLPALRLGLSLFDSSHVPNWTWEENWITVRNS